MRYIVKTLLQPAPRSPSARKSALSDFLIVAPTLVRPRLPYATAGYMPSMVEISIFAGSLSAFIMLYALFTRFFPIVSIWEVREGKEQAEAEVSSRIRTYFPS